MEVFDSEGNPVDFESLLSQLDPETLPAELVQSHPAFNEQRQLFEQERDNRIADRRRFRSQIEELQNLASDEPETDVSPEGDAPEVQPITDEPPTPLDVEALYESFAERFRAEQEERERQLQARQSGIETLIREHQLPDDARDILALAPDDRREDVASRLAQLRLQFDDTPPGGSGNLDSAFDSIDRALGLSVNQE
jgi:hypothetical protein